MRWGVTPTRALVLMAAAVTCQSLALAGLAITRSGDRGLGRFDQFEPQLHRLLAYHGVAGLVIAATILPVSALPVTCAFCAWPVFGVVVLFSLRKFFFLDGDHVRGRRLLSPAEAAVRARALRPRGDRGLPWGGILLPSRLAVLHFLVVGAPGSGKTLTIRMLLGAFVRQIRTGTNRRAIVYDAKRDAAPILDGMCPSVPVTLLNPFDARSARWAMAQDVTSPAACLQVAEALIRSEEGPNQFFSLAGIELVASVMMAFNLSCPGRWTCRDLILAARDPGVLKRLIARHSETAGALIHFAEPRVLANILSTVRVRFAQLEPVASAWEHAESDVSLEAWARTDGILVLGNDETARVCLDAINRAMLRRATEILLNGPEVDDWRTVVVLDEVAQAGKLDCLSPLLTKGRSKGVSVVLGFQDIDGFREVYGNGADELVGQCGTKAVLRAESPGTADWASRFVGDAEGWEHELTTTRDGESTAHRRVKREAALASEFLSLPPATLGGGICGYFAAPEVGAYRQTISPRVITRALATKGSAPDFVPRPVEQQYLRGWSEADLIRLGLSQSVFPIDGSPQDRHTSDEPLQVVRELRPRR